MAYGKVRVDQIQSSTRTVDVDNLATTAVATTSVAGLLSATDKTKLDGVATGAEVNVNADWNAGSGDAQILNKPTLGTAAAKNTGTAAGNVVELDGSARLPAVDGSQLTGINTAGTDLTYTAATRVLASSTGADATLTLVTSTDAGLAPASGGGTTNFLRADGTFAAPPGGSPGGSTTQVQFNNAGAFGGDADLTWNSTTNVLGITGDVNLSDGGTYTTTLQTITPTAARTISFPDATGTVALVGGSSGNLIANQSGAYAGVANSSVDNATGNITLGSRFISSLNGALSTTGIAGVPVAVTGTWIAAGGTATTTKPQVVIEPTGTTSTGWSTSGTGLGVNAASGFAGKLIDLQINGTSRFNVTNSSETTAIIEGDGLVSPGLYLRNGSSAATIRTNSAGLNFDNNSGTYLAHLNTTGYFVSSTSVIGFSNSSAGLGTPDVRLARDAAGTLAQRNGTNAQTFRVYNTYTSATNYELGKLEWSSNVFRIGTEKGSGGGTARAVEVHTDSISRLALDTTGSVRVVTALTVATLPGTPAVGMIARVTDALAPAVGTTVAGGGAAAALVWYNGANWSVIGV